MVYKNRPNKFSLKPDEKAILTGVAELAKVLTSPPEPRSTRKRSRMNRNHEDHLDEDNIVEEIESGNTLLVTNV